MTIDRQLEDAIRNLVGGGTSVSINQAAKAVGGPRWRSLTVPARRVAHRMAETGEIEIAAITKPTDALNSKNAFRIRSAR